MDKEIIKQPMKDHKDALGLVLGALTNDTYGAVKSLSEINAVGHRTVHGGEKISESCIVNDEILGVMKECIDLAPLHNPANIMGIEACQELMPNTPMIAVFDTAFHHTIKESAYIYALPYEYYEKYKIRRYGFHGTSHKYVSHKAAEVLNKDIKDLKIITCHLGNGASVAAIKNGEVVDTSMGFTPLEGLIMGTRCGDLDPAVITFLMEKENLDYNQVNTIMNKKSGVLGISGVSSDFRDIEEAAEKGNKRAQIALESFANRVRKYIGAYATMLGGLDLLIFTAGLGENSKEMREMICSNLEFLGVELDEERNSIRGKDQIINKDGAKTTVMVVPTNEELMIAKETVALVK
jgi:acetate kinase